MNTSPPPLTCVVTGASSGIGLAVSKQLARAGARLVVVCRASPRVKPAFAQIERESRVPPTLVTADLSLVEEAEKAAQSIVHRAEGIDVVIHNAGVWPMRRQLTPDGFETAFAVNHLAPFVMNRVLIPHLRERAAARIVQVTPGLYGKGRVDLESTPTGEDFHKLMTYAHTKLWNLLATLQLARELEGTNVTINAVHPGVVRTRLGASFSPIGALLWLVKRFWLSPTEGARGPVYLALDPGLAGVNGGLYDRGKPLALEPVARDPQLAARVVDETVRRLARFGGHGTAGSVARHG